jgi:hypothetical protein
MPQKILKYLWLITAILALGAGIHLTITSGFRESYPFFIIFSIALAFYFYRKNL